MNKAIFALLLIGLTLSLKSTHFEDSSTSTERTPTPNGDGKTQPPMSPEAEAANLRLMAFIMKDHSLRKVMQEGGEPTGIQLKKLMGFMINDPFFSSSMLDEIVKSPDNAWIGSMSKPAQLRFLKIVTDVPQNKLDNPKIMKTLVVRLLKEPEIGDALKAKFGADVSADALKDIIGDVKSKAAAPSHLLLKRV